MSSDNSSGLHHELEVTPSSTTRPPEDGYRLIGRLISFLAAARAVVQRVVHVHIALGAEYVLARGALVGGALTVQPERQQTTEALLLDQRRRDLGPLLAGHTRAQQVLRELDHGEQVVVRAREVGRRHQRQVAHLAGRWQVAALGLAARTQVPHGRERLVAGAERQRAAAPLRESHLYQRREARSRGRDCRRREGEGRHESLHVLGVHGNMVRAVGSVGDAPQQVHLGSDADERHADVLPLECRQCLEDVARVGRHEVAVDHDDLAAAVGGHGLERALGDLQRVLQRRLLVHGQRGRDALHVRLGVARQVAELLGRHALDADDAQLRDGVLVEVVLDELLQHAAGAGQAVRLPVLGGHAARQVHHHVRVADQTLAHVTRDLQAAASQ
ncbi:hypothetical protein ON010_g936 [Phytophthora cinnamomi]|nr:hypothetical protein ON010_g936 [Phytophthora cinnamomi]